MIHTFYLLNQRLLKKPTNQVVLFSFDFRFLNVLLVNGVVLNSIYESDTRYKQGIKKSCKKMMSHTTSFTNTADIKKG